MFILQQFSLCAELTPFCFNFGVILFNSLYSIFYVSQQMYLRAIEIAFI